MFSKNIVDKTADIMVFVVNSNVTLLGQAPCKKIFTVICKPDEKIKSFSAKLYLKYVESFPDTYGHVTLDDFIQNVRFIYAGKKIFGEDEGRISDYKIGDESTLDEWSRFGAPSCSFVIGKERREFEELYSKDREAAMLMFQCRTQQPGANDASQSAPSANDVVRSNSLM